MTTNQTIDGVPRELMERILSYQWFPSGGVTTFDHRRLDRERLIAMVEAERCTSCDGSGDLTDFTGEWRGYCVCPDGIALKNKPAAQSQGDPVADALSTGFYVTESGGGKYAINIGFRSMADMQAADQQLRDLLRSRHAPVAPTPINYGALDPVERLAVCRGEVAPTKLVLPERSNERDHAGDFTYEAKAWNACLDELKRLNPSL